jgi:hypothetical protein
MIQICEINYIPRHGYPRLDGQEGDETLTVAWHERNPVLPDYWTAFYDGRYPLFSAFTDLVLRKRKVTPVGIDLFEVEVEYHTSGNDGTLITLGGGASAICTISNDAVDVPIAQHPNYRTIWNHDLHMQGQDETLGWVTTVTDTVIEEFYAGKCAWAKPGTKPQEGWRVYQAATKPGVESYLAFLPVVHVIYTGRKSRLERTMAYDGMIRTPPETFGIEGLKWLQVGSSITKQGKDWQLATDFRGSKTIDTDIYEAAP